MIVCLLLSTSLLLGGSCVIINQNKLSSRQVYIEVYGKYASQPKTTVLVQDIEYEQEGSEIKAHSILTVQNRTEKKVNKILLYLNPDLKITSITSDGVELHHEREHQVVQIHKELQSGDTLNLHLNYKGKIDENTLLSLKKH